ncbi:glycosyltransferase [Elongatibacter sediminis]|uniref:Glycosyltransferase n=1 Tax=Elongatibacter sediminis TaxID=3119006 RepID=A0AAW9R4U7_9GAMM
MATQTGVDTEEPAAAAFIEQACSAAVASAPALLDVHTAPPERTAPLDIAIPIHNGAALLRACLTALIPTLSEGDTLWLIDDASDDAETCEVIAEFATAWRDTRCITLAENRGFVGACNEAFRRTTRDIVLLNSDTEVGPHWLEHLQDCLARHDDAAIVCPISNRATILSVCPDGSGAPRESITAAVAARTAGFVELPTAVGFCMLIRREALHQTGPFSQTFAPGYGEENDLSMRCLAAGWRILAADRACVFHHSGGSFTAESSRRLRQRHQQRLDRIWPEYGPLVRAWWRDNPLRARTESLAWPGDPRPAVIHVLHRQYHVGGTERVTRSLIRELSSDYRQWLVYPGDTEGPACDLELRAQGPHRELMLNRRWIRPATRIGGHGADFSCAHAERALARIIRGSEARIVHFHHLLHWDSLVLARIARRLGCRVLISVHDFWFNCPIHNQLEHHTGQPCGRPVLQPDDRCRDCLAGYELQAGTQDVFARARQTLIRAMFHESDALLVPSRFIRDKMKAAYPDLPEDLIHVHPHGVALPESGPSPTATNSQLDALEQAESGRPLIIGYFGGDQVLKGAEIVLHLAQALTDAPVRFRIHGRIKGFDPDRLPTNVELRGFYNPDDVGRVMAGIDLGLLPSHYEESFSMVASECWAHGVPVLASSRGALAERVQPGTHGWLVADMRPESWTEALSHVLEEKVLSDCRARLRKVRVTSIQDSAHALAGVYRQLLESAPIPDPEAGHDASKMVEATGKPALDTQLAPARFRQQVSALRGTVRPIADTRPGHCLGVMRDHWGTAHYRIRFPLEDLASDSDDTTSHFHVIRDEGFDLGRALAGSAARHVAVQPFLSDEGLRLMDRLHREPGTRITLVVDDLWTALAPDNPARTMLPDDVPGRLAQAAALSDALVLTTPELRTRLDLNHPNIHVIENALPDWIWNAPAIDERQNMRADGQNPRRPRIGWAGAPQHGADLAFLEPVVRATADRADWLFLGMCPEPLQALGVQALPMGPFDSYPKRLAELDLDIAIAPLTDHPFNRCKSHLKVLENGILGVPVIAADLPPYQHCPVPLAAPDDAEDWISRITHWLDDETERLRQARRLQTWILEHHLSRHRRERWLNALGVTEHDE